MPRKPFEDAPYDPIATDLARDVAAAGRTPSVPGGSTADAPIRPPQPPSRETQRPRMPEPAPPGPQRLAQPLRFPEPPQPRDATITKRFVLTRNEDDELNEFLLRLQRQVGTKVTLSVFVRAVLTVAMQAESQLLDELRDWPLRFPSTHDAFGQGAFEAEWIRCVGEALRRLPRIQAQRSHTPSRP